MALFPSLAAATYFRDNYVLMGYLAPAVMFFFGMRVFARVMQIRSRFLSVRVAGLLSVVFAAAIVFFPPQLTPLASTVARLGIASLAVVAVLTFAAGWLARLVVGRIASGYGRALRWFAAMAFFQGLGCLGMVTSGIATGVVASVGSVPVLVLAALTAPFLVGQVAQVGAGYFAKKASQF
jgi:hypothetical protein